MYCRCHSPKVKRNMAYNKSFEVCSAQLGGCGKEMHPEPWKQGPPPKEEDEYVGLKQGLAYADQEYTTDPRTGEQRPVIRPTRFDHPPRSVHAGPVPSHVIRTRDEIKQVRSELKIRNNDLWHFLMMKNEMTNFCKEVVRQDKLDQFMSEAVPTLMNSLSWFDTRQGHSHWVDLHDEFNQWVRNMRSP